MADVIVVGGGPAGSAAAALLARTGCRVLLLEEAVFPRPKPCGDYLNPGCGPVLTRLGLRDRVASAGHRVHGMRVVAPEGTAVTVPFDPAAGWALSRRTLDHLLIAHAMGTGVQVVEDARVVGLERVGRRVRVFVERRRGRTRETHIAPLVIGADGVHSTVARAVGAGSPLRRGRFTVGAYLEGLAPFDGQPGDLIGEIHLRPDCYCGVAYLPGGVANVTLALGRRELRRWRGALASRYWDRLRTFPGLADRLGRARQAGEFATSGPLGFYRRRAAADAALLVGDAAALIDPMTGQGLYLALRGAELAAAAARRALDGGGTTARALAEYDRVRRGEFGRAFLLSRALQLLAFQPAVIRRAARQMTAHPHLGVRLLYAIANVEDARSVLRPAFFAQIMGLA